MRQRATRMSSNAHGPLKTLAALIAAMFAATAAPAFDWTASDLSTQYQDSGGTLPVTNVEQPAGLVLDRSKGGAKRGLDVVLNGGFNDTSAWSSLAAGVTISGGVLNVVAAVGGSQIAVQAGRLVVGKIYEVTYDVLTSSGGAISIGTPTAAGIAGVGVGRFRDVFAAAGTSLAIFARNSTTTATVDNVQVREITGANLWQGTPAVKDANWTDNGDGSFTSNGTNGLLGWTTTPPKLTAGRTYECIVRITSRTGGSFTLPYDGSGSNNTNPVAAVGTFRRIFTAVTSGLYVYSANFNGTVDSIYIAEIPGNHLIQPTSASRPTLSARVNLLTYSEQFDNAIWAKTASASVVANTDVAPDGTTTADTVTFADGTVNTYLNQGVGVSAVTGNSVTLSLYAKTSTQLARFGGATPAGTDTYAFDALPNGWFRQKATRTFTTTASGTVQFIITGLIAGAGSYVIWGAQYSFGSEVIRYQRIAAATDYDAMGFAKGWRFDGVDDSLYSPVSFSWASTKVSITAAIRKLSDAATAMVAEFGPISTSDGTFYLAAPLNAGVANVGTGSRGTSAAFVAVTGVPAPAGLILSMTGDIAAPSIALRVNGVPSNASSTTQGAGSYGNYVMNVGRRNNATNPFNGLIHSLRGNGRVQSPDELGWLEAQAKLDMNNNL